MADVRGEHNCGHDPPARLIGTCYTFSTGVLMCLRCSTEQTAGRLTKEARPNPSRMHTRLSLLAHARRRS